MCFDFFYKFVRNFSHCMLNWARYFSKYTLAVVYSGCYCCQILTKIYFYIYCDRIKKNTQVLNFMKTLPVGAESSHADGRTDKWKDVHDEANSRFWKFCEHDHKDKISPVKICDHARVGIKCMWDLVAKSERKRERLL
jgi:hypothetical protein